MSPSTLGACHLGLRIRRNDRDVCPQSAQIDLVRRDAIVENISFCKDASEQHQSQRTSSAPSRSDNTGTFTKLDVEVGTVVSRCCTWQTSSRQRVPCWRQIDRRDALRYRLGLLFDVGVLLNSLQAGRSGNQSRSQCEGSTNRTCFR